MAMTPLHAFEGQSLAGLLAARCEATPEAPLLTWAPFDAPPEHWTYARFADDAARLAGGLAARGIGAGQRVLLLLENAPEVLLAWFACAWRGAVCVPANAAATAAELQSLLERTGAAALLTQPRLLPLAQQACAMLAQPPWLAVTASDAGAVVQDPVPRGVLPFQSLRAEPVPRVPVAASAPAGILFTSGTTARPKGVVWTHANLLWAARLGAQQERLRGEKRQQSFLPLFHVVGLGWSVLPSIWAGGSVVLQPRFSASRFWEAALAHRCTWASMVPFCTAVLARQPVPAQHSFRTWGHAVYEPAYERLFGVRLLGWWGMTEVLTQGLVGDEAQPQTPQTIGRPSTGYAVTVVDDAGRPVAPGTPGELRIRGERGVALFLEYLDDPQATAEAFDPEGFFRTGDRVLVREDGSIQFVDRIKDVIKVGGENVAAPEVERVVAAVPGVREVAVVARLDAVLGEVPVAFVRPDEGHAGGTALADAVLAACQGQLARFKRPQAVFLVDDFPRVAIGKIAKAELRRRLQGQPR
jgi:carnitine-CoA ligase